MNIAQKKKGKGWGAVTIVEELKHEVSIKGKSVPSVSSVNKYLKSIGKSRNYRKVCDLPKGPCYPSRHPFDIVQMDAEGNKQIPNIGTISTINAKDIHTKGYLLSYPLLLKSKYNHPTRKDYQRCIRLILIEFGIFKRLQVDHESIFYENTHLSPYPTNFHLWLIGLGIDMIFTTKGRPYKQGMVERCHQTMDNQVFHGHSCDNWEQILQQCYKRRNRLNYNIPSRALKGKTPFEDEVVPPHSGIKYTLSREKRIFSITRIHKYLAECKGWCRAISRKQVSLGGQLYRLKNANKEKETKILFNLKTKCFDFYDSNGCIIDSLRPKGLGFDTLSDDIDDFKIWYKKHRHLMPKK